LHERPAAADPVAVAAVDEFVGAAGEAALGGVLARREPGDEPRDVEVPEGGRLGVRRRGVKGAYCGMMM
jgi:hypothetical protein